MLAFLAALIPIAGSLLAGGSFLAEQTRLAHESRVRYRVDALVDEHSFTGDRDRLRSLLLEANGVPEAGTTWADFNVQHAISGTLLPRTELHRQWILLTSATVGLVLLCTDTLAA